MSDGARCLDLTCSRGLEIGASVVFGCEPSDAVAEQQGNVVTLVFQRPCGHVGLAQFNASEVGGIPRKYEALKAVEMPCYCMHPLGSEYR